MLGAFGSVPLQNHITIDLTINLLLPKNERTDQERWTKKVALHDTECENRRRTVDEMKRSCIAWYIPF